jgi:mono/diheme cytochrome c family protein
MHSTIRLPLIATAGAAISPLISQLASQLASQLTWAEESNLEGRGEGLLSAGCARCHAIGRTGQSPHSASPAFRTPSHEHPVDGPAESLAQGLSVGHPDMPESVFRPDGIATTLAYLSSIQER